ncbi:unnamed protein product, partial [Scytosiphon promiscuus]
MASGMFVKRPTMFATLGARVLPAVGLSTWKVTRYIKIERAVFSNPSQSRCSLSEVCPRQESAILNGWFELRRTLKSGHIFGPSSEIRKNQRQVCNSHETG